MLNLEFGHENRYFLIPFNATALSSLVSSVSSHDVTTNKWIWLKLHFFILDRFSCLTQQSNGVPGLKWLNSSSMLQKRLNPITAVHSVKKDIKMPDSNILSSLLTSVFVIDDGVPTFYSVRVDVLHSDCWLCGCVVRRG